MDPTAAQFLQLSRPLHRPRSPTEPIFGFQNGRLESTIAQLAGGRHPSQATAHNHHIIVWALVHHIS